MRAELLKHKLVVFPIDQTAIRSGSITCGCTRYRMVNVENPEEFIEIVLRRWSRYTRQRQRKSNDLCLQVYVASYFALPTGEDPDKISSEELDAKEREAKSALKCANCGTLLYPVKKRDGSLWEAEEQAVYSGRMFKHTPLRSLYQART